MKIGILQCGHLLTEVAQRHGAYPQLYQNLLSGYGFEFESYSVVDMEFPKDVHDADGWLLSGSRHGAYEDLPFIAPLEDFIRKAYAEHVPLVGICFGHQIIAQALGGKVVKSDKGWAIGHNEYDFEGLGKLSLNAWHQDQIVELPKDAKVTASSEFCNYAGLAYQDRALTIQAHPEFSGGAINDLIKARRGAPGMPDDVMDEAIAKLEMHVNDKVIADQIAAFFKQPREAANV
jgi:GMP synthase-like glutamine amidotransferase